MRLFCRLNQDALPNTDATAPSDDLFGDDSLEPTKPTESVEVDVKPSPPTAATEEQPSQAAKSETVDPQPSSGAEPVTGNSSGIAPVAQFIPSDAKLDQPTISPDEPLGTGETSIDKDTKMDDAPSEAITTSAAPDSTTVEKSEPQTIEEVEPVSTAVDSANSVPTPPAEKSDLPNGAMDASQVAGGEAVKDAPSASDVVSANGTQGTSTPQIVEPVDQTMMDTPSSGTVRPRDDAEGGDEPSAKRARTEEPPRQDAAAEPKQSEARPSATSKPATSATAPVSNGNVARPRFSTDPMKPTQKAVLVEKIKNTKKVKSALFFLKPVDPIAQNIPHYLTVITQPMDLGTMEKKLKADQYSSVDAFVADFELMVNNCLTFNGPQHPVSVSAQNLRAYFLKQMETVPTGGSNVAVPMPKSKKASPKPPPARRESRVHAAPGAARSPTAENSTYALLPSGTPQIRRDSSAGRPKRAVIPPQRELPYQAKPKRKENQMGLKFCDHILEEFKKPRNQKITAPFAAPVDPVALNIPTYFNVIKKPMDLQTMTNKFKNGQYGTAAEFKADFDLMVDNCFSFNPPGNIVHTFGKEIQGLFAREWAKKDMWIKKNTPQSQRASPASDVESEGEESEADEVEADVDGNEATIAMLRQQLLTMQNTIASISGGVKPAKSKKKKGSSVAPAKPSKKASVSIAPKASFKAKPKKQRTVTYEEKQEISTATENMNDEQINKLTTIITENVAKYKVSLLDVFIFLTKLIIICRTWTLKMSSSRLMTCPMMSSTSFFAMCDRSFLQRSLLMMAMPSTMITSLSVQPLAPVRRSISR